MTSQDTARKAPSKRSSYHHGNLRDALIDVSIELISSGGVATFSIAEACRRLDVSPGAPYRHFADREELLTAIAIRALETLTGHISRVVGTTADPVERLVRAARGYVEFAALHPALFEVLFAHEVFMGANTKLAEPGRAVVEAFLLPASEIPGVSPTHAVALTVSAAAVAHGYASFLPAGTLGEGPDAMAMAADNAACATRALIIGRAALAGAPGEHGIALGGLPIQGWIEYVLEARTDKTTDR